MMRKKLKEIIDRYGIWRTIQALLACGIAALFIITVGRLAIPVKLSYAAADTDILSVPRADENASLLPPNADAGKKRIDYRSGLFKPASGLRDQPLADKTIERIKSQLKLRCVMEVGGRPAAYINMEGHGVKKYSVGSVTELFTVADINVQAKSVDLMIVDHKVTLSL
jgi:hypothetical protein